MAAGHADPEVHPAIARAQAVLAAAGARHHASDLPEMAAADARLRVELDGTIGVHHGPSVCQNLRHGNRVQRPHPEQRSHLCERVSRARQDQIVPDPDALAREGLRLVERAPAQALHDEREVADRQARRRRAGADRHGAARRQSGPRSHSTTGAAVRSSTRRAA